MLTDTGGITTALPALETSLNKRTGSEVVYEAEPEALVDRLLARYRSDDYHCSCYPTREAAG